MQQDISRAIFPQRRSYQTKTADHDTSGLARLPKLTPKRRLNRRSNRAWDDFLRLGRSAGVYPRRILAGAAANGRRA